MLNCSHMVADEMIFYETWVKTISCEENYWKIPRKIALFKLKGEAGKRRIFTMKIRFSLSAIFRFANFPRENFSGLVFPEFPVSLSTPEHSENTQRTLISRKRSQNASQGISLIRFHPGVGSLCAPFYRNNYEMPLNTLAHRLACKYTNTANSSQLGIYVCREPVRCNLFVQIKGWFLHASRN